MKRASRRRVSFSLAATAAVFVALLLAAGAGRVPQASAAPVAVDGEPVLASGAGDPLPEVLGLSPSQITCGEADFTLTVLGTGFAAGARVLWNGEQRDTGVVSSTMLTATVTAADVAEPGSAYVSVVNVGSGGGQSPSARVFSILSPAPEVSSISPQSVWSGGQGFELAVEGQHFTSSSTVQVAGVDAPTTFVSAQLVTASVPATTVRYASSLSVRVYTPPPGGGLSPLLFLEVIDDNVPPVTRAEGLTALWNRRAVTLTLVASDEGRGIEKTFYRIDGADYETGRTVRLPAPSNHSNDGLHIVDFFSVDRMLNFEEPPKQVSVGIDTTPPTTSVSPATVRAGAHFSVRYFVYDALSPKARDALLQIVDRSGAVVERVLLGKPKTRTWHTGSGVEADLAPGVYRMRVLAHDLAGNAQSSVKSGTLTVR